LKRRSDYKDVKLSEDEVERMKRQHEDSVVEELRVALPHIHLKEIRRLVKELGDGNKVLEFLTGVELQNIKPPVSEDNPVNLPSDIPIAEDQSQDPEQDILSASMEILSLNPKPSEQSTPDETSPDEPISQTYSTDVDDPKHKARQRRQVSAARKQKQAKAAQKEAAKRRKRMEALGIAKMDDTPNTSAEREHILKAIVI
jgi:hypothetical protein